MTDDDMQSDDPMDHHDDTRAQLDMQRALAGVRPPDALRRSVEEAVAAAPRSRLRGLGSGRRSRGAPGPRPAGAAAGERRGGRARRPRLAAGLGGAAAVLLAALVVVLATDGGGTAPGVQEVAGVALRPPAAPAPATRPGGELLDATAGPIAFPTWTRAGWRAVGERTDTVDGHELRTVLYADAAGRRIGYAIADAELPVDGGRLVEWHGARLRVLRLDGAHVVTWRRAGRTCILAGRDVPLARLVTLAGYAA